MTETTDSTNDSAMQVLMNKATQAWWRCEAAVETIRATADKIEQRIKSFMESTHEKPGMPVAQGDSNCTDNSVRGSESAHVNVNRIEVSERTLAVVAIIIAALALGMIIMLPAQQAARVEVLSEQASKAEREARVMQERWNDLKVELAKRGIPVSDH